MPQTVAVFVNYRATQNKQCTALKNYIAYCRRRFGVHTLRCTNAGATECTSSTQHLIVKRGGRRVCGAQDLKPWFSQSLEPACPLHRGCGGCSESASAFDSADG